MKKKFRRFPFRYSGEYFDKSSNMYYLRARYYSPNNGRFISEDSYWGEVDDPLSLNLYIYCINNPVIFWDPSGHNPGDGYMEQYYLLEGDYVYASKTIGVSSGYGWQVTEQEKDLWQTIKLLGDLLYLEVGVGAGIGLKANIFEGIEAGIVAKYAVVTGYDKDFFLNFENVAEGSIGNWIIELTGSTGVVTDLITGEKFDVTDADLNLGELETLWTTNKEITDDRFEILGVEAYVILGLEFEFGFNKDVMEELVGYDRE